MNTKTTSVPLFEEVSRQTGHKTGHSEPGQNGTLAGTLDVFCPLARTRTPPTGDKAECPVSDRDTTHRDTSQGQIEVSRPEGREEKAASDSARHDNPSAGAYGPSRPACGGMEEHRRRLSADPRFAGWVAGGPDLGPLDDQADEEVTRRMDERKELMRIASVRALRLHQQIGHLDAEALAAAKHWAAVKPLGRPL